MAFAQKLCDSALGFDRHFNRKRVADPIATSASLAGVVSTARMMPLSLSAKVWI
jgi:hypothetical protein